MDDADELDTFFTAKIPIAVPHSSGAQRKRDYGAGGQGSSSELDLSSDDSALDTVIGKAQTRKRVRKKAGPSAPRLRQPVAQSPDNSLSTIELDTAVILSSQSSEALEVEDANIALPSVSQMLRRRRQQAAAVRSCGGDPTPSPSPPARRSPGNDSSTARSSRRTSERLSVSTEPTSRSEEPAPPQKKKRAPAKASAKRAKKAVEIHSSPLGKEPSPQLVAVPSPPKAFWSVATLPAKVAAHKRQHRVATKALRELSKLDRPPPPPGNEVEIVSDSDETVSELYERGARSKYEPTASKAKRLREQKKKELEASRAARKAKDHAPLFGKKGSVLDLFGKQAEKAISDCPVCNAKVPLQELQAHTNICLDNRKAADKPASSPEPPPRPARQAKDDNDPGSDSCSPPPRNSDDVHRDLAQQLFGSDPPHRAVAARRDKGKGRAEAESEPGADDSSEAGIEPAGGDFAAEGFDDDYSDDQLDDAWEDSTGFAKLHGTTREVLEIDSDDDIEVQVAAARILGPGGAESVNVQHLPGPPCNGCPDAAGQIYISTMSPRKREGFARLFKTKSPKKSGSASKNPLAPQKMTTASKAVSRRGAFKFRGRGARRGGGRKRK